MAREGWKHEKIEEKPEKTLEGGKTVRFVGSESCDKNERIPVKQNLQNPQNPVSMVQSLVPHLPGLDKDTIYVISGPFPNYDPVSGPSQLLMATPISPGVTVVAVPLGPPPSASSRQATADKHMPHPGNPRQANSNIKHTHTNKTRREPRPQQPMPIIYHPQPPVHHPMPHGAHGLVPHPPHMLHWDTFHPVGQTIPLRQPNPPVYYNVPSHNSSGMQSPGSDGSSMSCSDISDDQDEANQGHPAHGQNVCYFHPNMPNMPQMMGYPPHLRNFQGHSQFCNLNQQRPVYPQQGPGGQNFNQAYIS